jgi:imidazoleglycerol-phosphate dehydratase
MRSGSISRETKETKISVSLNLDGTGRTSIQTGIPFFDHMLTSFGRHGRFDLDISAAGDLAVGPHHTVEDVGLVLGSAFRIAIAEGRGIRRFSHAIIPMDEARASVSVDVSGRAYLVFDGSFQGFVEGVLEPYLIEHFFMSFSSEARITLHMEVSGRSDHHKCEALFKSCGVALHEALEIIYPDNAVPSTKGVL